MITASAALISAAISLLKSGGSHRDSDKVLKTLGGLAQQISTSSGLGKSAKDQMLDEIAKLVQQIASSTDWQHGTNHNTLNTVKQLIDQISHAKGLDQSTKNHMLDELAKIVQQLKHSGSGSSGTGLSGSGSPSRAGPAQKVWAWWLSRCFRAIARWHRAQRAAPT